MAVSPERAAWLEPRRLLLDLALGVWVLLVTVTYLAAQLLDALALAARTGR